MKIDDNSSIPDLVFVKMTENCNLKCKFCYNESDVAQSGSDNRPLDQCLSSINSLIEQGVQNIAITGGEPREILGQTYLYFNDLSSIRLSDIHKYIIGMTLAGETVEKILEELRKDFATFSELELIELYSDIISPILYKLELEGEVKYVR